MNKMKPLLVPVVAVAAIAALFAWFRSARPHADRDATTQATPYEQQSAFSTIRSNREVIFHCSNSMRLAMEWIAAEFQRRENIAVVFNYGGGSELLPLIELGNRGDLFLCHDPYEARLKEKGLLADSIVIGRLRPVILVPKGNPNGIRGLADLGRTGLRIATVDRRYATAGKMTHAALDREPWGEAVRANIAIESRGHSDAALAVTTGHADAAVVWNFLAALYADQLDKIECGVEFPEEIRVTLCKLISAENHEETAKLMEFAQSDYANRVWTYYGYRDGE